MSLVQSVKPPSDSEIAEIGAGPSLVQYFGIEGLYGYRSISLASPFAATILIAKNGSGKSTLLGALDAVLKCQFYRLQGLDFKTIRLSLRGLENDLTITREDVESLTNLPPDSELLRYARLLEVDVTTIRKFLSEDYPTLKGDYSALTDTKIFSALLKNSGFNYGEATNICQKLQSVIYTNNEDLAFNQREIRLALNDVDVLYLPTFRRVELPLQSDQGRARRAKLRFATSSSLYGADIQFGLGDIHDRLSELNQRILADSNIGYRRISANIINELIDGTFERDSFEADKLPDRESLELFFSRLREGGRRIGPYSDVNIPSIEKIYGSDDIGGESRKTLRYFLSKLYDVINSTKDIELRVEEFIAICNKYLSDDDESADTIDSVQSQKQRRLDGKLLRLNRRNLKVHAESTASRRKIPLDSLSSGEKQMVSLFAKLYLYEKEKLS